MVWKGWFQCLSNLIFSFFSAPPPPQKKVRTRTSSSSSTFGNFLTRVILGDSPSDQGVFSQHHFSCQPPGQVVASVVSRLGDCEALVRTAAKECLAKAGEGSHPSPQGSLNPQLWHSQPCRSFFSPFQQNEFDFPRFTHSQSKATWERCSAGSHVAPSAMVWWLGVSMGHSGNWYMYCIEIYICIYIYIQFYIKCMNSYGVFVWLSLSPPECCKCCIPTFVQQW